MNIENTKAQMRKGVLEFCILSVLKEKDAYTSEILDTLKNAKLLVVEGTVYPLLTRLKNDGLLNYRWEIGRKFPCYHRKLLVVRYYQIFRPNCNQNLIPHFQDYAE